MIITTTSTVEGRPASQYMGIVVGEAILGANVFKDIFGVIIDVVGGSLIRGGWLGRELL